MNKERAIEIIENLRDYAYENWDDYEYDKELDEIGVAVDLIKNQMSHLNAVGNVEVDGKKYLIVRIVDDGINE